MSSARRIVPVDLGGSPHPDQIYPPPRERPTPELVRALIEAYGRESRGLPLELAFFRGVPDDALLEAGGGLPTRVSCSPADLSRAEADRLAARGVWLIELEVLTYDDRVLKALDRGYNGARVDAQRQGLEERGVAVGLVLMPGLPGSSHQGAQDDVDRALNPALPKPALLRILPAIAFEGSGLYRMAEQGRWRPMRIGEAITTVAAMLDRVEPSGVPVARVGMQPIQDTRWIPVFGTWHPNLRGLVDQRRMRARMNAALQGAPAGGSETLRVNPADLGSARGASNKNVKELRLAHRLRDLRVIGDPRVPRGQALRDT